MEGKTEGGQARETGGEEQEMRGEQEKKLDEVRTARCEEPRGVKCKDQEHESRGHREEGVTRG